MLLSQLQGRAVLTRPWTEIEHQTAWSPRKAEEGLGARGGSSREVAEGELGVMQVTGFCS